MRMMGVCVLIGVAGGLAASCSSEEGSPGVASAGAGAGADLTSAGVGGHAPGAGNGGHAPADELAEPPTGGSTSTSAGSGGGAAGAAAGAGGNAGSGAAGAGGAPVPTFQLAWLACERSEDCVVIASQSCCGCSDQGVNAAHAEDARAASNAVDLTMCPPLGCATAGCHLDARAECVQGTCTATQGCSGRPPTAEGCEGDGTCALFDARQCQNAAAPWGVICGEPREGSGSCAGAAVCRVSPDNGAMLLFQGACVPEGWEQECPVECP